MTYGPPRRRRPPRAASRVLLQEVLAPDPWRLLVGCMLLNQTQRVQADRVWPALFARWPTAEVLALADERELAELLRPLGLYRRRARSLRLMSAQWAAGERDPRLLYGVGRYAVASYEVFVQGRLPTVPVDDKELAAFLLLRW